MHCSYNRQAVELLSLSVQLEVKMLVMVKRGVSIFECEGIFFGIHVLACSKNECPLLMPVYMAEKFGHGSHKNGPDPTTFVEKQ